jgi:hypothetical protein
MVEEITQQYITDRIGNWEQRIRQLYENITIWAQQRPSWRNEAGRVLQRNEKLMRDYNITPRELPSMTFFRDRARVSFVPSALWVIGANGRINITANTRNYILADMGGENGNSSNWRIALPETRLNHEPFTEEAFLRILDDNG